MRTTAAALFTLSVAACGGSEEAAPPVPVVRLALEALETGDAAARVAARYPADDLARPWRRKRDLPIPVVDTSGRPAVKVAFDVPVSARIASELRTTEFDTIAVDARLPAGAGELLRVTLVEGRRKVLVSEIKTVEGTGQFETIEFPLPGIERVDVALTEISIQVAGQSEWTEFTQLVALDARPAALLPRPGGEPALVDLESEARRGWGLDAAVGGAVEVAADLDADTRLSFSYAVHPGARGSKLVVERGSELSLELPLGADEAAWLGMQVTAPAGRVTFRVEDGPERTSGAWTAVAELNVETPVADRPAPLVLLVTSDTHRGDHLSRGGTPGLVDTPRIDALAARGVQWTNAYAPSNMTNPSHVALMTGLSPRDTRIVGNRAPLAEEAQTIAEHFAAAGWATAAAVSVQHIGHAYSGLGQGFDRFDGLEERADYRFSRRDGAVAIGRALEWIDERRDVPLFLWVHVFDVHGPYDAPEEFTARYLAETQRPVATELDPVPAVDPPDWIASDPELRNDVRAAHARYRAAVDRLDAELGPLFEHPRAEAGWIAFTGDHGEAFGRNQMWWTHHGLYRDQLHVPLILAGAGLEQGVVIDAPARMIDLGATLLERAGIHAGAHPAPALDLSGDGASTPRFALGFGGLKAAVEHEGWLLVLNLQDHEVERGPRTFAKGDVELYHVAVDPGCATERSSNERERCERLRAALIRWLEEANDGGFATAFNVSDEAQKRLVELGYAGNAESTHAGAWFIEEER